MGSGVSIAECRSAFHPRAGDRGAARGLRLDEERADLGRAGAAHHRNAWPSPADVFVRQRALLAQLIGGDTAGAETIATRLIGTFGSLGGVLCAQPATLAAVADDPALADRLSVARAAVLEGLGEQVRRVPFELTDFSLQQWIIGLFKGLRRERIHLALLDAHRHLIFDEPLADGTLQGVAGNLRKIVSRGLGLDAAGIVLMHNHPSGNVQPSPADIAETRRIAALLGNLDLPLQDHLVVAGNSIFSMRKANML